MGEAEGEGERKREEVSQAVREAEEAVQAFEEATQLTTQALEVGVVNFPSTDQWSHPQVALRVSEEARNTLSNATLLASRAEELSRNVSATEDKGVELEAVSMETAELITMATEVAQTASSDASRFLQEIQQLLVSS